MMYRIAVAAALLALVVAVILLSGGQRDSVAPTSIAADAHDPGYSALDARLIQTGPDGQPRYTLDADRIQQRPERGLVELQQVRLSLRDDNGNPWNARARRGELAQNSGMVKLEGAVVVTGIIPGTRNTTQIATERLSFDTNAQVVTTRDPVRISMSGRDLNARGMTASLKDRHVQLESAVHGSFTH